MDKISRIQILKNNPWLNKNEDPHHIIMGDDLDAAISAVLYLHSNPSAKLIGVYKDYQKLYVSEFFFKVLKKIEKIK